MNLPIGVLSYLSACRPDGLTQNGVTAATERQQGTPGTVWAPGSWGCLFCLGSRADRGREMGQIARINAKKKFCAKDVIPAYEAYYRRVLEQSSAARA
jgi:hypothetical protein